MIIEPKSLEQMEEQLKLIPEAQRKVLVLVGRHPNEGTFNIAREHHKKWEAHGAVVIRIPAKWTPHGFWHDKASGKLPPGTSTFSVPSDADIINFLAQRGFHAPVLNFHSSPHTFVNSPAGDVFKARNNSCLGLYVAQLSSVHEHSDFQISRDMGIHPSEICVELHSEGVELPRGARARLVAERFDPLGSDSVSKYKEVHQVGMGPRKVNYALVTARELNSFKEKHGVAFEKLLAHLAKTGLKPEPVEPKLYDPFYDL